MAVYPDISSFWYGLILLLFVVGESSLVCRAQCSPGAIVCETFGNGSPGPLPKGQTNFTYKATPCPDDGEYTLTGVVSESCHGQAWHEVTEDHTTGDRSGNMFVVNASYQPSEFYSQSVAGLCPGVTYEFSLWALNLNRVLQAGACDEYSLRNPVIAMRIEQADGTLIREVIQPAVARTTTPTWVFLSMQFAIQTNSPDIVVKLINKGLGGCGNDLAIDDIGFRPVHPTLTIQLTGSPASATTVCADTRLTLAVGTATGYPNPAYAWQQSRDSSTWTPAPGTSQATYAINPVLPGRTFYRLRNTQSINATAIGRPQCSAESNVLTINGRADAPFRLGDDLTFCAGTTRVLEVPGSLPAGTTFVWSDQSQGRQLTVATTGVYWLQTDLDGCTYRDSVSAEAQPCQQQLIYVPDAFTPNEDAVNDRLIVQHPVPLASYEFRVYNRWGGLVFVSDQADRHWDGTFQDRPCNNGVYAWVVTYSLMSSLPQNQPFTQRGQVLLIR